MRGRGAVRQRGAVHEPQLPAQRGARARVHPHARPAPAQRGLVRAEGPARRRAAHVSSVQDAITKRSCA